MNESKTSKYFKYAMGEIVLVVIGILIALYINNWNQEKKIEIERITLVTSLQQELNENLIEITDRKTRLLSAGINFTKVLNYSAGANNLSIDSVKTYLNNLLVFSTEKLSNSRLNAAKNSGQLSLLSSDLSDALMDYETSYNNYKDFRKVSNSILSDNWFELAISLNSLQYFHNLFLKDTKLNIHPQMNFTNSEFKLYLQRPEIFKYLYKVHTEAMVEMAWLDEVKSKIENSFKIIEQGND